MAVPRWLKKLRRELVVDPVRNDKRTQGDDLLGVRTKRILDDVIGWGQADFDAPIHGLDGDDRALLYAYFNQPGHLDELIEAFTQLFKSGPPAAPLIVVDVGCGPFTGGLALAAVFDKTTPFSYIGMDRSLSMQRLGENLAIAATEAGHLDCSERQWMADFASVKLTTAPGWRPLLVIVSYLLASPTLVPDALVDEIETLCARLGRGPVTVLYTNAPGPQANRSFGAFKAALEASGFSLFADDSGSITIERSGGKKERTLRYALFHRNAQTTLKV